jgi:adenylylsulfate kinase-like enzyme
VDAEVFWLTGLAGVGKTTIAKAMHHRLVADGKQTVLLDGDALREALGGIHGYAIDERRYLAECYGRLCKMFADQGSNVVCATVSMFSSVRQWNRDHIDGYREIYITAPEADLLARRPLYREAPKSEVVGFNPTYELPENPDVVIVNDGQLSPAELVSQILTQCKV